MDNLEDLNCRLARYLELASRAQQQASNLNDPAQREEWGAIAISWMNLAEHVKRSIRRAA